MEGTRKVSLTDQTNHCVIESVLNPASVSNKNILMEESRRNFTTSYLIEDLRNI